VATAAAGDVLSETTNSLNSISKFEQYAFPEFLNSCNRVLFKFQNSVTQYFSTNNSGSFTA